MTNPWERNAGKYDAPSSTSPTIDPDLERSALRGVAALAPAEPVAVAGATGDSAGGEPRDPDAVAADRLRQIIERWEALIDQRHEVNAIISDIRAFAKGCGYEPVAILAVIRARAQDPDKRKTLEGILDTYRHVMGVEGPDMAIRLPPPAEPMPPPPRRLSAAEKRLRDVLAMQRALSATDDFGGGMTDD